MKSRRILVSASLIALLVGACAAPPLETGDTAPDGSDAGAESAEDEPTEAREEMSEDEPPEERPELAEGSPKKAEPRERVPEEDADAVRGEVPEEILEAIIADLAGTREADPAAIEVLRAESVTWNDGSLGCPEPGRVYMQVLVPGYRVILVHDGQQFDYRATDQGHFVLCS